MNAPLLTMAWRNLARKPGRTAITVVGLGLGLALSIATWVLLDGFLETSVNALVDGSTGHVLVQHPGQLEQSNLYDVIPDTEGAVAALEADPAVRSASPRLEVGGLVSGKAELGVGATIVGLDPLRDGSRVRHQVVEGRFLEGPGEVLVGKALAHRVDAQPGDELLVVTQASDGSIGRALWTLVGLVETGNESRDRAGAWTGTGEAQALIGLDGAHSIVVRLLDGDQADAVVTRFAALPGWTGVLADLAPLSGSEQDPFITPVDPDATVVARSWRAVNPLMGEYSKSSAAWALVSISIVLLTAAMGTLNTMLMSVMERTRELGVLMAVGLEPLQVVVMVVLENLALGLVATGIGVVLGGLGSWWLVETGIDFGGSTSSQIEFSGVVMDPVFKGSWSLEAFVVPIVALGAITFVASLIPALRAASLDPVVAFREGR